MGGNRGYGPAPPSHGAVSHMPGGGAAGGPSGGAGDWGGSGHSSQGGMESGDLSNNNGKLT